MCGLTHNLLRNMPVARSIYADPTPASREEGLLFQHRLLTALMENRAEDARKIALEHMISAEKYMLSKENELKKHQAHKNQKFRNHPGVRALANMQAAAITHATALLVVFDHGGFDPFMCGICGEVRFDGATPSVSAISKMADILAPEGQTLLASLCVAMSALDTGD